MFRFITYMWVPPSISSLSWRVGLGWWWWGPRKAKKNLKIHSRSRSRTIRRWKYAASFWYGKREVAKKKKKSKIWPEKREEPKKKLFFILIAFCADWCRGVVEQRIEEQRNANSFVTGTKWFWPSSTSHLCEAILFFGTCQIWRHQQKNSNCTDLGGFLISTRLEKFFESARKGLRLCLAIVRYYASFRSNIGSIKHFRAVLSMANRTDVVDDNGGGDGDDLLFFPKLSLQFS